MHNGIKAAAAAAFFTGLVAASVPARADLSQFGTQVEALYIGPALSDVGLNDIGGVGGFFTVGSGITFQPTSPADSYITVDPTQIIIQNNSTFPFCFNPTAGNGCSDAVDEFAFAFQQTLPVTGTNTAVITGVTVDPSSSAAFLPVTPIQVGPVTPYNSNASDNGFYVNVFNDDPAVGGELVLDLTFQSAGGNGGNGGNGGAAAPEPASAAVLGAGLLAAAAFRGRRR